MSLKASLDAPGCGWTSNLQNAGTNIIEKGGDESHLSNTTDELVKEAMAMLVEVTEQESTLASAKRADMVK